MNIQYKHWKILAKILGCACLSFIMFVLFVAISNVGIAQALFFAIVLTVSCSIAIAIGERNHAFGCGLILVIVIIIFACITIWNAAFPPNT